MLQYNSLKFGNNALCSHRLRTFVTYHLASFEPKINANCSWTTITKHKHTHNYTYIFYILSQCACRCRARCWRTCVAQISCCCVALSCALSCSPTVCYSRTLSECALFVFCCCFKTRFWLLACFVFVFAAVFRIERRHIIMYTIAIMAVVVVVLVIVAVIVIVVAAAGLCENQKTAHQLFLSFFQRIWNLHFAVALGEVASFIGSVAAPILGVQFHHNQTESTQKQ